MKKVFLCIFAGLLAVTFTAVSVSYAGKTEVVSVDSTGNLGNNFSNEPAISVDGRYVAFRSLADNLVSGDKNEHVQLFVHDRQTGSTEIVSKDSNGNLGNSSSGQVAISADGRFVAFQSLASNLVPGDTNNKADIFVRDRKTGSTEIVSKDSNSKLGNSHSAQPAISSDGRFVAFESTADNLVTEDKNGMTDIFVHDRKTGATKIISKDSNGKLGNSYSDEPAISADGRFVAFRSAATNLVAGDINDKEDIFVHDRKTGSTKIMSVDSKGKLGNDHSDQPAISADGRYVAFESLADNLVPGDINGTGDAFVHDRQTGITKIVSVDSAGKQQENGGRCFTPAISDNGRYVAFESEASNLVPGDTNGKSDVFVHDRQ